MKLVRFVRFRCVIVVSSKFTSRASTENSGCPCSFLRRRPMPIRPKRPCSYPGCPELVADRYCEAHQKLIDARYNKFQRNPATGKRYGGEWRKIRGRYIKAHPLCEMCKKAGKLIPAEEVHHIIPLSKGGTHVESNLMSLCTSCHSTITAQEGGRWGR